MEEALDLARAKDTKQRMAAVERLHHLLESSRKPLSSSEVTSLVDTCLDLLKDNNFRVSQGSLLALASAAVISGDHFKIHFNALVPATVERLGDAKQPVRDAARRLLLTLMEVSSPTIIVERAGSYAWEHKSWRVREEFARTVTSAMNLFASTELPLQRAILPPILHMLNDPNHSVREAAISCIEEMYMQIGPQFQEELQRHQLPSYMVKDINARLERIEPKPRSSDGAVNSSIVNEHKVTNHNPKRNSPKAKISSRETSLFGADGDVTEKPVDPVKVYSEKELIREFEKIASTLVPEKDWSHRIAAMQRFEGLVIGGAADYPCFRGLLKQLIGPLSTQLSDRRSSIVKQACHLLNFLSKELLGDFEACAEHFIPVLFKLVVITVLVIAESADNCIKTMLRNCKVARLLPRIADCAKSDRNAALRARCCDYALLVLEHWPDEPEIQRAADLYEDMIRRCVGDAVSEVRTTARACYRMFAKTWPDRSRRLFQSFDPVIQRIINEEDGGLHRRHASPSVRERNVPNTPQSSASLNMPGYGTSAIVAMDKTATLSSRASVSSGMLLSQSKSLDKGSDRSLESVLNSSKEKVSAIESLLRGLDLSSKHNSSTIRSSSLDLGVDPPSSRDPPYPLAVPASNQVTSLSLDSKLSSVTGNKNRNGGMAHSDMYSHLHASKDAGKLSYRSGLMNEPSSTLMSYSAKRASERAHERSFTEEQTDIRDSRRYMNSHMDRHNNPFFPSYSTPPPPSQPPPSTTALPTFPANISSLALPSTSSPHHSHHFSPKLTLFIILLSLLTLSLFISLSLLLLRRHRHHHDHLHTPPEKPLSPLPPLKIPATNPNSYTQSHTSTDFLYVGNAITNSRDFQTNQTSTSSAPIEVLPSSTSEIYLKLCSDSPELRPLPPLPKQNSQQQHHQPTTKNNNIKLATEDEEFYSPRTDEDNTYGLNFSPARSYSDSLESDSDVSVEIQTLAARTSQFPANGKMGPPAPPPPPPSGVGPPPLVPPSGPVVFKSSGNLGERKSGERKEENGKPKLKALHWDKVRATSDRATVWDQFKPGSFQLNEEMIETLFKANGPGIATKDGPRRSILPLMDEEYRVLDPKKSQNIAILLKALNVTEGEVCEALLEGNADGLGSELLESLLKMAPTHEEERKLREYNDRSPLKLGPAEKFLKAVLDHVPAAFKRVGAMLYIATFDSEIEYLRKSFETLEAACAELRNSRMFLKLLEAVLKTGNRMNVGTNRGDAQAIKLDTLLKLIDVKGTDGKTTLLHFVVQEITRAEGFRLSSTKNNPMTEKPSDQPFLHNDIELRKRGLEVVSGLGGELTNVKKAAAMDFNSLSMDVAKLTQGIIKVNEVLQLNENSVIIGSPYRFSDSMNGFLKKAEVEIVRIQAQESCALSRVKELTEYFHGNLAHEEAHPLRIFMVVRDFLGVLDQVCKEVGKINERTIISSARPISVPVNPSTPPPFPEFSVTHGDSSSDSDSITEK